MEINGRKQLPELLVHYNLPLVGIEVGVEGGNNAYDLLVAGLERIYLVDTWQSMGDNVSQAFHDQCYEEMMHNMSVFSEDRYTILKGLSSHVHAKIPNRSVGLLYIDGDHSYEGCKADIENYYPKLIEGGIMAFHDYANIKGVNVAVNEFASGRRLMVHMIPESNHGDAGAWFRLPI